MSTNEVPEEKRVKRLAEIIEELSSPSESDLDKLRAKRIEDFDSKVKHKLEKKFTTVNVGSKPLGIVNFGDIHIDNNGCNFPLLEQHFKIVKDASVEGLNVHGGFVGDLTDNWVGRLNRLYAHQSTTLVEAQELSKWAIEAIPWMYFVHGNHDCLNRDTQVLTARGWKNIDGIFSTDKVWTFNQLSKQDEWNDIQDIIIKDYDGELIEIETELISLSVTPNHRILHKEYDEQGWYEFKYIHAKDITKPINIPHSIEEDLVKCGLVEPADITRKPYKDKVWCLTVANSNFLVRRNNKSHFTGNCWNDGAMLLNYFIQQAGTVQTVAEHEVKLKYVFDNGVETNMHVRHNFKGHSQYHTTHGMLKKGKSDPWADVMVSGHTHDWGVMAWENETGKPQWAVKARGYKFDDSYSVEGGWYEHKHGSSIVTIINPNANLDGRIHNYLDVEEGVDFLRYLTNKR